MQLYSLQFVLFLLAALAAYFGVGRVRPRAQWVVLLVASMGFYLACGWQNLFFIVFTAATTFACGLAFARLDAQCDAARQQAADRAQKKQLKAAFKHRKWMVALAAMMANFGVLGYIKYWNVVLAGFGADQTFLASRLLLPLGISFYTFQSISYVIDTYNGKYPPERNFARYLLFVSWFPQLIQGPINRFDELAQQLHAPHRLEWQRARRDLLLIGYGAFKKFAIAEVLTATVSAILDNMEAGMPGSVVAFGVLLYTIQQYGDFSGGIDMVRGISQLFGVEMARNFRQPYFATSMADFWRRWHMSLGAWMRDYVFYPLALRPSLGRLNKWGTAHLGKHLGRTLSACISNIVVFFLVGLWHGAETHFILWGLYNGVVIALADVARPAFAWLAEKTGVDTSGRPYHVFAIVRTFVVMNIGRYFDRLEDFGDCLMGLRNTLLQFDAGNFVAWLGANHVANMWASVALAAVCCAAVFAVSLHNERGGNATERVLALPVPVRALLYAAMATLTLFSFTLVYQTGGFMYANF